MVLLGGCIGKRPIRVGFAGELTGRNADLSVQGRNGVQLAVKEINAEGGVAGRALELLVRDDEGTPEGARAADQALIDAGVVAIIGHMTSGQSVAAVPVVNETEIILLSPTTSTPELSGLKDNFFRVNPVNAQEAMATACHMYREHGLVSAAIIYDDQNAAYTDVYRETFESTYHILGGEITGEISFSSDENPDFALLVDELRTGDPAAVLIVTSDVDAALIAQQVRLAGWEVPLSAAGWAQTEALLQNGGAAVEGMHLVTNYDSNSQAPAFLDFKTRYQEHFGRAPTFAAAQAYESVFLLAAALEKTNGNAQGLSQALVETRVEGLTGPFELDEYGDVVRTQFLIIVREGEFVTWSALAPEDCP
ncbi:MAG: ABC transporter substrate-binding protein [Anaerolineae bacterium]